MEIAKTKILFNKKRIILHGGKFSIVLTFYIWWLILESNSYFYIGSEMI